MTHYYYVCLTFCVIQFSISYCSGLAAMPQLCFLRMGSVCKSRGVSLKLWTVQRLGARIAHPSENRSCDFCSPELCLHPRLFLTHTPGGSLRGCGWLRFVLETRFMCRLRFLCGSLIVCFWQYLPETRYLIQRTSARTIHSPPEPTFFRLAVKSCLAQRY